MRAALWPHAIADHPQEVDGYLRDPGEQCAGFVAEDPGGHALCGFLEARLRSHADGCSRSPVAYIEGWWVDPEFRRSGVGAALVRAAESWAASLGVVEMASDSEIFNEVGRLAHVGLGFREAGRVVQFFKRIRDAD